MQAAAGACIEPGEAPAQTHHAKLPPAQILDVDVRDFQFAPRRGLQLFGNADNLVVVEVHAGNGKVAFRGPGFLFDRKGTAPGIDLDNAVTVGIVHLISEDGGASIELGEGAGQPRVET